MAYEFGIGQAGAQRVASIRHITVPAEIGPTLGTLLPEVFAYLDGEGIKPSGPPFVRYHEFRPDRIDLEAGFPIAALPKPKGRVGIGELPGGRMATTTHIGPYETLNQAYDALIAWIKAQGHQVAGAPWDIYWTDPGQVPDPSQWRTEVRWPIQ